MATNYRNTRISERNYYRIEPQSLTQDGGVDGQVYIASTYGFKVGQKVTLRSDSLQSRIYKIKRVESETLLRVGPTKQGTAMSDYSDVSDMLLTDNATIVLPEQKRPGLDSNEVITRVFEEEPAVALRSHAVDWLGRSYGENNPFPVQLSDGSVTPNDWAISCTLRPAKNRIRTILAIRGSCPSMRRMASSMPGPR